MANIKNITLPTGTTYSIVDQGARDLIDALSGYTVFLGVTTTALVDGSTTNPITVGGKSVTATNGAIVTYGSAEFIFNGTSWQAFGDLSGLGALAFKDSASGSYKPAGTITTPEFTGTAATISVTYTPEGSVSNPTFTGTPATITSSFTPEGTVTIGVGSGTKNYTPDGSVSLTDPTVSLNTTQGNFMTGTGTLPSATMPVFSTSVENETLILSWTSGSFDAGSLPTMGAATTVATGVKTVTAGTATFSGTGVCLTGSFSGTAGSATASYTPAGTNSGSTFTGTEETLSTSYTPAGSVTKPTFSGTTATIEVS